ALRLPPSSREGPRTARSERGRAHRDPLALDREVLREERRSCRGTSQSRVETAQFPDTYGACAPRRAACDRRMRACLAARAETPTARPAAVDGNGSELI